MAWVKLDDGWLSHPKTIAAGKDGRALAIAALCWAARAMTDGKVPISYIPVLAAQAEVAAGTARRLLEVGIWHQTGDRCPSPRCEEAGLSNLDDEHYLIHDYLEHNPSKSYTESRRTAGKKGAASRYGAPTNGSRHATASSTTDATANSSRMAVPVPVPVPKAVDLSDRQTLARSPSGSVGPSGIIDEALGIHAQVVLAKTNPATVRNPIRYLAGIAERAGSEHGPELQEYLRDHPHTTSVDLAKAVFGHDDFDLARIHQEHTA